MKFVRFLVAIVTAMMAFPSFAETVTFNRESTIMVPNPRPDGSFDSMRGRSISRKATLTVHFVPLKGLSKEAARQRVEAVLSEQFRVMHEGVRCYPGVKEARWWNTHVRRELQDNSVPVTGVRAVYQCR
ncbi:MAG: hypothetical protein WA082_01905 [Candidatus Moraniibacteriota bacterium]